MKTATWSCAVLIALIWATPLDAQSNPDCDGVRIPASVSFDLRDRGIARSETLPGPMATPLPAKIGEPVTVAHTSSPLVMPTPAVSVLSSMSIYSGGWSPVTSAIPTNLSIPWAPQLPLALTGGSPAAVAIANGNILTPASALVAYANVPNATNVTAVAPIVAPAVAPASAVAAPAVADPDVVSIPAAAPAVGAGAGAGAGAGRGP